MLPHGLHEILQILCVGGVRRTVRKTAVDLAVHGNHFAAQLLEERGSDVSRGAVARVYDDAKRHGDTDVADDLVEVGADQVFLRGAALALAEVARIGELADPVDGAFREGLAIQDDLQAVVVHRGVAARDHDPRSGAGLVRGEVQQRCRDETDVDNVTAGLEQGLLDDRLDPGAALAAVVAEGDGLFAELPGEGAHRATDAIHGLVVEIRVGNAADVVGTKNMRREIALGRSFRCA